MIKVVYIALALHDLFRRCHVARRAAKLMTTAGCPETLQRHKALDRAPADRHERRFGNQWIPRTTGASTPDRVFIPDERSVAAIGLGRCDLTLYRDAGLTEDEDGGKTIP